MDRIRLLRNPVRAYDWGSRTALAELTGRPAPTAEPEAELWVGAHPSSPSEVCGIEPPASLLACIEAAPEATLGTEVAAAWGPELPFLLKLLATERALSIQTHPDAARARAGFAREDAAGTPVTAPGRSYRDPHPKPELVCALSRFEALCGFREIAEIEAGLAGLEAPELAPLRQALAGAPGPAGLSSVMEMLLGAEPEEKRQLAEAVARAAERPGPDADARAWIGRLAEQYPGDPGVLAPVLLNRVTLEPGEALFLDAGEIHAYLEGLAVEIMANSDNVLRGGLTAKHVDLPELLDTLTFRCGMPERLVPREVAPGVRVYDTPAREFELAVLSPREDMPVEVGGRRGIELLLCTEGRVAVASGAPGESTPLAPGEAAVVPAAVSHYRVEGHGTVYRAGVPH